MGLGGENASGGGSRRKIAGGRGITKKSRVEDGQPDGSPEKPTPTGSDGVGADGVDVGVLLGECQHPRLNGSHPILRRGHLHASSL